MEMRSLHEVMNDMARAPQALMRIDARTEIEAYCAADPLLADLRKHSRDARGHYESTRKARGPDDPMAEVAADMADSTQCAFETRLIEARLDQEITERARAILRQREETLAENERTSLLYRMRMLAFQDRGLTRKRIEKEKSESVAFLFACSYLYHGALARAYRAFTLAGDFRMASLTGMAALNHSSGS